MSRLEEQKEYNNWYNNWEFKCKRMTTQAKERVYFVNALNSEKTPFFQIH